MDHFKFTTCLNFKVELNFRTFSPYLNSDSFTGSELDLNWASTPITFDTVDGQIQVSSFEYKEVETKKVIVTMGSQAGNENGSLQKWESSSSVFIIKNC